MGERTPLALIDAPASGRMAVGEALTNLAAAPVADLARRQALGELDGGRRPSRARTRRSTTRCAPSALELCPRSASRSRSARTRCRCARRGRRTGERRKWSRRCRSIVSAFAPSERRAPRAHAAAAHRRRRDRARARSTSARGRNRLGGSALAQVYGQLGDAAPDLDDPAALKAFFAAIQALNRDGLAPRLPRPLRRRPLRLRVRDGVRRALRRDAQPRPPRLRPARARRRRQRASARADAGARPRARARGSVRRGAGRGRPDPRRRPGGGHAPARGRRPVRDGRRRAECARRDPAGAQREAGVRRARASICSAPGRRRATGCSRCATTRRARRRSSTASSTPAIRA